MKLDKIDTRFSNPNRNNNNVPIVKRNKKASKDSSENGKSFHDFLGRSIDKLR